MCSATIYWAHIGRIVYAGTNDQLAELTGPGNKENFTMKWHTRDILEGSQKDIEVIGPVEGMDKLVMAESDVYWKTTRSPAQGGKMADATRKLLEGLRDTHSVLDMYS